MTPRPNQRASPTANWSAAADAAGWPVGGGLRTTLGGMSLTAADYSS